VGAPYGTAGPPRVSDLPASLQPATAAITPARLASSSGAVNPVGAPGSAREGGKTAARDMDSVASHPESEGIGELRQQSRRAGGSKSKIRVMGDSVASQESARAVASAAVRVQPFSTESRDEVSLQLSGSGLIQSLGPAARDRSQSTGHGPGRGPLAGSASAAVSPAPPSAAMSSVPARTVASSDGREHGTQAAVGQQHRVQAVNGANADVLTSVGNGHAGDMTASSEPTHNAAGAGAIQPSLNSMPSDARMAQPLRNLSSARTMSTARMGDHERRVAEALESRKLALDVAVQQVRRTRRASIK
jgi:hypothetical protein